LNKVVVDTNVPIVANGRPDPSNGGKSPSPRCRLAAIDFLEETIERRKVLLDLAGEIQSEYRDHLNSSGEPGVGDRFYQQILYSAPTYVERIDLPRGADGEFEDFPTDPDLSDFDRSDRKFVAMANRTSSVVVNATDSDWLNHRVELERNGIELHFVCGTDRDGWQA
jgi:hypothetical protein